MLFICAAVVTLCLRVDASLDAVSDCKYHLHLCLFLLFFFCFFLLLFVLLLLLFLYLFLLLLLSLPYCIRTETECNVCNCCRQRCLSSAPCQDLLRAIRNKKHHYRELPENLKQCLGAVPEGYLSYVIRTPATPPVFSQLGNPEAPQQFLLRRPCRRRRRRLYLSRSRSFSLSCVLSCSRAPPPLSLACSLTSHLRRMCLKHCALTFMTSS